MPDMTYLRRVGDELIGYPGRTDARFPEAREYMDIYLNNIGDPYASPTNHKPNTHTEERTVVEFFAKDIWGFEDPTQLWGYVTASGTEGNLQGCYIGREILAAKSGGAIQPILYTSVEAHYSLFKTARLLNLRIEKIETDARGFMDMQEFEKALERNRGSPALVAATIGTTMKGAIDWPERLYQALEHTGMRDNYYMHVDGALMGNVLPLARAEGSGGNGFDLQAQLKYAHSISVSGHKFMGVPFPCGVFLSWNREHLEAITQEVQYIGGHDLTVMGSRSGHSVLYFLEAIIREGRAGLAAAARSCLQNAHYLLGRMQREFRHRQPFLNPDSLTVVFNCPSDALVEKHQLATTTPACGTRIAHIITVGHVSKAKIDRFLDDLKVEEATREYL
ncbi:conserved unknown protein [Ectocarpus siliculosus]|uniref:Histidine decarboxylase n=1 Tax=Ectocarpus siliculosus TaxID=2880 RepID=D7G2D1_ECTSI|nr:conserved unknown protein [Ectocarpus siliculosus]|eukprot:CBJ48808.1 conserved unknown protein [Ectocarpus siliculosus]